MQQETPQLHKKKPKALKDDVLLQLERGLEDIKAGRASQFKPQKAKKITGKMLRDDIMLQLRLGLEDIKAGRVKRVR